MTDDDEEYDDEEYELIERLAFPISDEDWLEANAENEARPTEPGRMKLRFGDGPPRPNEPWEGVCPDCKKLVRSRGGGIKFAEIPCKLHTGDCLVMHIHWSEDCPAWNHRRWRFWHIHTWGRVERRLLSWKWRHRAKKERSDPSAWTNYWSKGGK